MDNFAYHCLEAVFTNPQLSKYLDVSERTIRRWKQHGAPLLAQRAIEWQAGSKRHWEEFHFRDDHVVTPSGHIVRKQHLANMEYYGYINRLIGWDAKNKPAFEPKDDNVILLDQVVSG